MYTVTENSVSYKQKYDLETQVEKQEEMEGTNINGVPTHVLGTHILLY